MILGGELELWEGKASQHISHVVYIHIYIYVYIPGPSKGSQMVAKGCQFNIP